ncbi:BREX system ATP-binding protein BrxD [Enhygromyxa salina]|uniref:ATP/GTP binding protein n=1 Tax=Enhygromyxa salina TaxID=215803 RepID=A0A2S9YJ48_9BACT|nr:BREX system ATP-binding protein BrxD [Enhygromyxa salina]PRQ05138.1 hypothetical protein ENSA7_47670 [Enhygromyxa salina]
MTSLTLQDIEDIFEKLRGGAVPERGLDSYAVGIDRELAEIRRQLELVGRGGGYVKFLRGDYGCGKTFMARLAVLEAQNQGFATSFVVVSDNDLKFHRFDDVYRKVVSALGTAACPRGALSDILDRWIGKVEEGLIATDCDPDAADFDAKVAAKLAEELTSMIGNQAPAEFVRVIQKVFELKQAGELTEAAALLSWLSGSTNVAASAKKIADIRGEISSRDAMAYLRGIVGMVHAADYKGLVIVIDEAETILRMRRDSRGKSLNGIRQIYDDAGSYERLLWIFTGTPDFFDSRHGVAGLTPLYDRIGFSQEEGGFANVRQPQLALRPFGKERLRAVARALRDLYQPENPQRHKDEITDDFIDLLVDKVTEGFRGHVGLVPRHFIREFINKMDLVQQEPKYKPMAMKDRDYVPRELTPEEENALAHGGTVVTEFGDDDATPMPAEEVW